MPGLMQSWFVPHKTPKAPKFIQTGGGAATGGTSASGVAPGISAEDFRRNQTAQYQQMLSGLGIGTQGGELPQGIQQNIDRQASLIGG